MILSRFSQIVGEEVNDVDDALDYQFSDELSTEDVRALLELCDRLPFAVIVEATITDEQALLEAQKTLEEGVLNDRSDMEWFSDDSDYVSRYKLPAEQISQITKLFNVPFVPLEDLG